jgi:phenylacetate-CoA ligase
MEPIFLEHWLHEKITHRVREDSDYRQFIGKGSLDQELTRSDVEDYQLYKLRKILSYAYEKSDFYKKRFKTHGIKPDEIQTLADLAKIPFTEPSDIAEHANRFLCVSHGDITRVTTFTTSGTTGPQKRVFCTEKDLDRMTDFMAVGLRTVADNRDVLQIILPFGTANNQGDLLAKGAKKMGIFPVKAGMKIRPEDQIELIRQHGSTVLFVPTPYLYRMTKELEDKTSLGSLGVRALFVTSGYLSEPMRNQLKRAWNCRVHTHYGLSEMGLGLAVECSAYDGYHFNEADTLLEIIDPRTGETLNEGEGELVFTTLSNEGMPLIRYRTHDLSHLIPEPCPCGATTLLRFGKISRRLESGVRMGGGDEIYFSIFDEFIYNVSELVDYQISVAEEQGKDLLVFTAEVTHIGDDVEKKIRDVVSDSPLIRKNVGNGTMAEPEVNLVALGAFKMQGRAKKMIASHG